MAQQTAVEWFFKWFNDNQEATHKEYAKAFEQAKQMEKEQIIKAYEAGWVNGDLKKAPRFGEEYYNDTFLRT